MQDKVLEALRAAGKPLRPGDIAKAIDLDSREVSKILAVLKDAGKIVSPKRCFYSLPE